MAGIMNNTARQYNLKCVGKNGNRVTVRVAPGFNVVNDEHWVHFKGDPYVEWLKKKGLIGFGKKQDDMELEMAPDTVSKSKSSPPSGASKADASAKAEMQKYREKVKEEAKAEAKLEAEAEVKKEADKLKADAKTEADKIKADAKMEADKLKADAKVEADKLKADAKSKEKGKGKAEDEEL